MNLYEEYLQKWMPAKLNAVKESMISKGISDFLSELNSYYLQKITGFNSEYYAIYKDETCNISDLNALSKGKIQKRHLTIYFNEDHEEHDGILYDIPIEEVYQAERKEVKLTESEIEEIYKEYENKWLPLWEKNVKNTKAYCTYSDEIEEINKEYIQKSTGFDPEKPVIFCNETYNILYLYQLRDLRIEKNHLNLQSTEVHYGGSEGIYTHVPISEITQ